MDLGWPSYTAHASCIVCVALLLPCYSVHCCAWLRTIMYLESDSDTTHPEHEHVIFVYLEIWHPRSHPTSRILDISDSGHLRFWTSRFWTSRSGSGDLEGRDLDLGVQTPRDPPDTPKTPLLGVNSTAHWSPALAQNPFVRRQMGARLDSY